VIDAGIPSGRDAWPEGVLESLQRFRQGDVIERPPLFYFADPAKPVWAETNLYTDESNAPEVIYARDDVSPDFGIITTQTCDIAEEDSKRPARPWVQISPVYRMTDRGWSKKLVKGRGPRYWMHIPNLPTTADVWAADLRLEMPIETGWLANQEPVDGFADEHRRREFRDRLTWLRSRPALARALIDLVQTPLFSAFTSLADSNPELHAELDGQIEEIALLADDLLTPSDVQLIFLGSSAFSEPVWEWLQAWRDDHVDGAMAAGISLQPLGFQRFSETSAEEYRRMTVISTGGVSPP
jgi:hypothetical protein